MLKLDNSLLDEIGLGGLPEDQKRAMLQHIYETLELRVGTDLANQMTDQQLEEFERFIDEGGDANQAQALQWLEANLPNYRDVVNRVFEQLKQEVKSMAPQIMASNGGAMGPAAGAPMTAPAAPAMNPAPQQGYNQMQAQGGYVPAYQPQAPAGMPMQPAAPMGGGYSQPAMPQQQPYYAAQPAPAGMPMSSTDAGMPGAQQIPYQPQPSNGSYQQPVAMPVQQPAYGTPIGPAPVQDPATGMYSQPVQPVQDGQTQPPAPAVGMGGQPAPGGFPPQYPSQQ